MWPLATYTRVLLANTVVPSWHAAHTQLPFVFGGSAMPAGGGISMAFTPVDEAGPARKMAVMGAAIALAAMHKVENDHGIVSEPFHEGRPGKLMQAAKACTAAGAGLTVLAGRHPAGRGCVRNAIGGRVAAHALRRLRSRHRQHKDPKYVVVPQRERLAARAAGKAGNR